MCIRLGLVTPTNLIDWQVFVQKSLKLASPSRDHQMVWSGLMADWFYNFSVGYTTSI